ncbi:hypothetical protein JB92DRAFT_3112133 [Gautieria morchelliformis]|nr:hypothetical protein JB92DRAFT_3112133 [Gautieria morchelliformis]
MSLACETATESSSLFLCAPPSTGGRSNGKSMQQPRLSSPSRPHGPHGPPKLSLLIPPTPPRRPLACGPKVITTVTAVSYAPMPLEATSTPSSASSRTSHTLPDSSGSEPSDSVSRSSATSLFSSPDPQPSPSSHKPRGSRSSHLVALTILSRHSNSHSRSPRGCPWGALRSACGRRRYVMSGLRAEVQV